MPNEGIHICVPTLNRYDMLGKLINSLRKGACKPTDIWIIDNGGDYFPQEAGDFREWDDPVVPQIRLHYWRSVEGNIGVARAWNWFIANTSDVRIICNDDIQFDYNALQNMIQAWQSNAIMSPDSIIGSNSFSCFMLPDKIVNTIGYFDEKISPNYAYFEDNDYFRRLKLAGFDLLPAQAVLIEHAQSSTLQAMSLQEQLLHHERFRLAEANYKEKWGGLPHHELYERPYNQPEAQKVIYE